MVSFERAMVVLSIVTIALSITIRLQFVIECLVVSDAPINSVGYFWR